MAIVTPAVTAASTTRRNAITIMETAALLPSLALFAISTSRGAKLVFFQKVHMDFLVMAFVIFILGPSTTKNASSTVEIAALLDFLVLLAI
jgi:hypothetical protein